MDNHGNYPKIGIAGVRGLGDAAKVNPRITLQDIAARAGVGCSTVSRALTGHPACSPRTAQRIRDLAEAMGYVPDPALSALVSYRDSKRTHAGPAASGIAIVSENLGTGRGEYVWTVWDAVSRACARLGYGGVQRINSTLHEPAALGRILRARGVRGIIWGWLRDERYLREFPWDRFAHIGFPLPVVNPPVTCVRDDSFHTVYDAVHAAFDRGFTRPGLMLMTSPHSRNDRFQIAGWLLAHAERKAAPSEPWLSIRKTPSLSAWLRSERPDLIIGNVEGAHWLLTQSVAGRRAVPPFLSLLRPGRNYPGFDCAEEQIGRVIVRELDRQIRHNELGLQDNPQTILVRRRFLGWPDKRR